jgi:hypothetical protein
MARGGASRQAMGWGWGLANERFDGIKRARANGVALLTASHAAAPLSTDENSQGPAYGAPTLLLRGMVAFFIIVGCLAVAVPFAPRFPVDSLDSGWMYALDVAVEKGLIFGQDVVFTFGPYASDENRQYYPATDVQTLWSTGLLAVALAVGLIIAARDRFKLSAASVVVFLALNDGDQWFFCIPLVFLLIVGRAALPAPHPASLALSRPVRLGLVLLVIALGLLPLIKGTFGLASVVVTTLGCGLLMARGEKIFAMAAALIFVVAMATFWMAAGQPIVHLPGFFAAQATIIDGYGEAMSVYGPAREPLVYVAACCALGLCHGGFVRSGGFSAAALASGAAFLLFLAFKAGFVRHDNGHAMIAAGTLGLAGWILAVGLPGMRPILGLVVCLIAWGVIDSAHDDPSRGTIADRIGAPFAASARGLAMRLAGNDALRRRFDESLRKIRQERPLPPLSGPVDIYSDGQSALLANALAWAPRPVLQSYSAYTPDLLEKNAAHVAGAKAPDNILFSVEPVDHRLGALEDGLSWPALLTRYEPVALQDRIAVLRRRPATTTDSVLSDAPLASGVYRLGEEIPLPAVEGALWAKVRAKPTLLGKLFALAYKAPELEIALHMSGGDVARFRYIAEMGEAGFVISPLVQSAADFLALELPEKAGYFSESRPQSVAISVVGGAAAPWLWRRDLSVQFSKMNIPPQPQARAALFGQFFDDETLSAEAVSSRETKDCWIDRINNHPADQLPPEMKGALRVEGWAAVSVKDGLAPDQTRITLIDADGRAHSLAAKITARGDVNRHFDRPEMGDVGFVALADISKFDGDYILEIRFSAHDETRVCAKRAHLSIAATDPDGQK